mgnify:CR=1 FL=1
MTRDSASHDDDNHSTDETLRGDFALPGVRAAARPEFAALRARLAADLFGVAAEAPRIGRFRLLERIGAGAMGQVFAAQDEQLGRRVALKLLHPERAETPEGRLALLREAQALARLAHPNVVSIFEVGEHGEAVFLAMEFVAGQTLDAWLAASDAPRSWRSILDIFLAAGGGLAAAHAAGLVHRDFKPSNVIVGDDGRVRVVDFGLARAQRADAPENPPASAELAALALTTTGAIAGTPAYMAPEVLAGQPADASADLYAFCVALYEALHGVRPHQGDNLFALALAKSTDPITRAPTGADVPRWLTEVVARGLSRAREDRWPSMRALLAELERDRSGPWRRRAAAAAAITAAAALAALGVVAHDGLRHAARAEAEADIARERVATEARRSAAAAEAERGAEVLRLAASPGHERDALTLGVQVLAPFAPSFEGAPPAALEGLAEALPAALRRSTLTGHGDLVRGLAFSTDGRRLASLDAGGEVRLWAIDTASSILRIRLAAEDASAHAIALGRDGARLLTIAAEHCVQWDTSSGARLAEIPCRGGQVHYDGDRAYSGQAGEGASAGLAAWDASTGHESWRVEADGSDALELRLDPARGRLFVAHGDGSVDLRGAADGHLLAHLPAPASAATRLGAHGLAPLLALAHRGDAVLVADRDGDLRMWRPERQEVRVLGPARSCDHAAFASDDAVILVGCEQLRGFDAATGRVLGESSRGTPVAALGDTVLVARAGLERVDPRSAVTTARISASATFAASPDGRHLAAVDGANVQIWAAADPRIVDRWPLPAGESVVASADPTLVATTDASGVVRLHEYGAGRPALVLQPAAARDVRLVVPFPEGVWVLSVGDAGQTILGFHDRASGRLLHRHAPANEREQVEFALHAPRLAALQEDGSLVVVDAASGERLCSSVRAGAATPGLAVSADGGRIAVITAERRLEILDGTTCETLAATEAAGAELDFFYYGLDGSLVERAAGRTTIRDGSTSAVKRSLADPCPASAPSGRAVLSPDGARLVSTCGDAVYLWRTDSGERLATIDRPRAWGWTVTPWNFSADGAHLLVLDARGDARILDARAGSEVARLRGWLAGTPDDTPWYAARLVGDGRLVEAVAPNGDLVRYAATRAGHFAAACRALADTEAAAQVAHECSDSVGHEGAGWKPELPPT